MELEQLLGTEIGSQFEALEDIEVGTEEYKTTVDGLTKLVDRAIEIEKIQKEAERNAQQLEEEKKDRKWKNGIAIGTAVSGIVVTVWGVLYTTAFERTDSTSTTAGKEFFRRIISRK